MLCHWVSRSGVAGHTGDPRALFPYWSFSKTVIAACALKLAEIGKLDLDATRPAQAYSLRQLLNHTAGLPEYGQFPEYHQAVARGDLPWSRDRMLEVAFQNGPKFQPGTDWAYSNVGYMLALEAVEAAAGAPYCDVVQDLVLRPLGLGSVRLAQTRADFAALHWEAAKSYHPGWVYHGCLIGTAKDAALLLQGILNSDLLTPSSLQQMHDRIDLGGAIPGRPWTRCGYGLGLMSGACAVSGTALGHSGEGPFCVNAVYHFPDRDDPVTVACFADTPEIGPVEAQTDRIAARF